MKVDVKETKNEIEKKNEIMAPIKYLKIQKKNNIRSFSNDFFKETYEIDDFYKNDIKELRIDTNNEENEIDFEKHGLQRIMPYCWTHPAHMWVYLKKHEEVGWF